MSEERGRQGRVTIEVGASPTPAEIRAAHLVADLGHDVIMRLSGEHRSPAGATADTLIDGVPYDIYCPRTGNIDRIVSAVASKGDQAHGVVVDLTDTVVMSSQLTNILTRVQRAGSRLLDVIVVESS
jgi:filamentous hemagglutinin